MALSNGILVRVKNSAQLAKNQGGDIADVWAKYAPGSLDDMVLGKIADKLRDGFKQQGVDADVALVNAGTLSRVTTAPQIVKYVGVGLLGASFVGVAWMFAKWGRK